MPQQSVRVLQPGETLAGGRYRVVGDIGRGSNAITYRVIAFATSLCHDPMVKSMLSSRLSFSGPAGCVLLVQLLVDKYGSIGCFDQAVTEDGVEVAVKVMSLRGMKDWKQLQLFEREAATLRALSHPSIPKYLDYFESDSVDDKAFFLVQVLLELLQLQKPEPKKFCCTEHPSSPLSRPASAPSAACMLLWGHLPRFLQELAPGKSLAELKGTKVTEEKVMDIARQLLQVLEYLGNLRPPVVHRDVKVRRVRMLLSACSFGYYTCLRYSMAL